MSTTDAPLPPDVNKGPMILGVCGSLVALALVTVVLRIWVRVKMIRQVGWDDWVMILAMAVMFAEMMVIIPQVLLGAGRHWQYIQPPENVTQGLKLNFVTQPMCLIGLCLAKVSVGLFLMRMAPSPRFRIILWCAIAFTCASMLGNLMTTLFQCRPMVKIWDMDHPGECMPPSSLTFAAYFNSSLSVLTDVLFALLPVPMLWKVKLNRKVKIAVVGVLSLGLFAAVAAIVKITYLDDYGVRGDFLYDSANLTIWTTVEICVAIIAASIPCLKPLFKTLLEGSSARYYGGGGAGYKYGGSSRSRGGYAMRSVDPRTKNNNVRAEASELDMYGQPHARISSDNISEESLFNDQQRRGDGITKTMQVSVTLDEAQRKKPKDMV